MAVVFSNDCKFLLPRFVNKESCRVWRLEHLIEVDEVPNYEIRDALIWFGAPKQKGRSNWSLVH